MTAEAKDEKGKRGDRATRSRTGKRGSADTAKQDTALQQTMDRLDHEFRDMERRMESMFQDLPLDWSRIGPVVHGWSMVPGRFGTPVVERFGSLVHNLDSMAQGWRKPLMDFEVDDRHDVVSVTCEVPGLKKDDIEVTVSGETVEMRAERDDRKYHGKLSIGEQLDGDGAEATYEDGILRVTIPLERPAKEKSRTVRIK